MRYISLIERRPPNISSDYIERLADALNVSVTELVSGEISEKVESPEKQLMRIQDSLLKLQATLSNGRKKRRSSNKRN